MGFWKFSPFLAIGILALYQVGILQAAPFRSASEKPLEPATLTEDKICLLLTAMLNDYVKLKVRELKQEQETEGSRSALEKPLEPATLTEDEVCLLLTAMLNDYVKLKVRELKQEQETEGSSLDSFRAKRCSNLSTCVLGKYTQDLNKFHTFPQTAIGVGAPGKKRVMASSLERDHGPHTGMIRDAYQSPPSAF